jgi:glycosyltransferase involved in cell wall biosynthesis
MKILLIIEDLRSGGKERRFVELLKGLSKYPEAKCEVVLMGAEIHFDDFLKLNIPTHYLVRRIKKDPAIFFSFYALCKKIKPDIIHSWGFMTSFYSLPVAKLLGIKFLNAMIVDALPQTTKSTLLFFKLLFFFSDFNLSNSIAGLGSYNAPLYKSACIHGGFDFKRLRFLRAESEMRKKFGLGKSKIIGMIGAFANRKDYPTFIRAALKIASQDKNIKFMAVGEGDNLIDCKRMVPDEYASTIIFTGKQSDIESIVNIFEIGVLISSISHGEGISNSIMEYMALKKPVIATKGGGNAELVLDGKTGYLIEPGDSEMLADKINYLLKNPDISKEMGNAGNLYLQNHFSIDNMVNKTLDIYQKMLY